MKYCVHCGGEIHQEAVVCVKCGRSVNQSNTVATNKKTTDDTMIVIIKIFLIIGCIAQGWLILPLAWCLPITISIFDCLKNQKPISTGLKVCTLLFVSLIAGVCLLCNND